MVHFTPALAAAVLALAASSVTALPAGAPGQHNPAIHRRDLKMAAEVQDNTKRVHGLKIKAKRDYSSERQARLGPKVKRGVEQRSLLNLNLDILNLGGPDEYVRNIYTGHGNTVQVTNTHDGAARVKRDSARYGSSDGRQNQHERIHPGSGDSELLEVNADVHIHRRDGPSSGPGSPGFVEVASTLFHSNLAKSVAGLVFSANPDTNSSDFVLGTSNEQSTQFYLVPVNASAPAAAPVSPATMLDAINLDSNSTSSSNTTAASANSTEPSSDSSEPGQMYQLRVPVLNSQTLQPSDYCASFAVTPPSPLSMLPCGAVDGVSQTFKYDNTTGQLVPVYPPTSVSPPMNAAVKFGKPRPDVFAADMSNSTTSTDNSTMAGNSTVPASSNSTAPSDVPSNDSGPKVTLFFVPSASLPGVPDAVASHGVDLGVPSSIAAALPSIFTPAVAAADVVKSDDADSSMTDDAPTTDTMAAGSTASSTDAETDTAASSTDSTDSPSATEEAQQLFASEVVTTTYVTFVPASASPAPTATATDVGTTDSGATVTAGASPSANADADAMESSDAPWQSTAYAPSSTALFDDNSK